MRFFVRAAFAAVLAAAIPLVAQAQSHSSARKPHAAAKHEAKAPARDQWGLTEQDWLTMAGPELRKAVGLPAAAPRLLEAVKNGDPKAMAIMSGAYAVGAGVPQSEAESLRMAQGAADGGVAMGPFLLAYGQLDSNNQIVPGHEPRYIALIKQSADRGYAPALAALGEAYYRGTGVSIDWGEARKYYKSAAEAGSVVGAETYGRLLFSPYDRVGSDVRNVGTHDPKEGYKWLQWAADRGSQRGALWRETFQKQDALDKDLKPFMVWSYGSGLVGGRAPFLWGIGPCMSQIVFVKDGSVGKFVIDWTTTTVSRGDGGTIQFHGPVGWGDLRDSMETRDRLIITLYRDKLEDPQSLAQRDDFIDTANALAKKCVIARARGFA